MMMRIRIDFCVFILFCAVFSFQNEEFGHSEQPFKRFFGHLDSDVNEMDLNIVGEYIAVVRKFHDSLNNEQTKRWKGIFFKFVSYIDDGELSEDAFSLLGFLFEFWTKHESGLEKYHTSQTDVDATIGYAADEDKFVLKRKEHEPFSSLTRLNSEKFSGGISKFSYRETSGNDPVVELSETFGEYQTDYSPNNFGTGVEYFVDCVDGDDNNHGSSSNSPFASISKALSHARDNDIITVLPGICVLESSLEVNHSIILRSQSGCRNTSIVPNKTDEVMSAIKAYHSFILEGFRVSNFAHSSGSVSVSCKDSICSSITITGCEFISNNGALNFEGMFELVSVVDSNFNENVAYLSGNGGAICAIANSHVGSILEVVNCSFEFNEASMYGGGIYSSGKWEKITLNGCLFLANVAMRGKHGKGGAVYVTSNVEHSNLKIENCTFSENVATTSSWGVGGAISTEYLSSAEIVGSTFESNKATTGQSSGYGGAVSCYAIDTVKFERCHFSFNVGSGGGGAHGGGMFIYGISNDGYISLKDCTFFNNTASRGSYLSPASGRGGAISSWGYWEKVVLKRCSFFGNIAARHGFGDGGAVFVESDSSYASLKIENCTFSENVATNSSYTSAYGGAISTDGHFNSAEILGSIFESNKATTGQSTGRGGGASLYNIDMIRMERCDFSFNMGSVGANGYGGGLFSYSSYDMTVMKLEECSFSDNIGSDGAQANGNGGAVYLDFEQAVVNVFDCTLSNNSAATGKSSIGKGGAITAYVHENSTLGIRNSKFEKNIASVGDGWGGAIYLYGYWTSIEFSVCSFLNNVASSSLIDVDSGGEGNGGAIRAETADSNWPTNVFSKFLIAQCSFNRNKAADEGAYDGYGGAVGLYGEWGEMAVFDSTFCDNVGSTEIGRDGKGGAIFVDEFSGCLFLENNTFCENTASLQGSGYGGAISVSGSSLTTQVPEFLIRNCSFIRNMGSASKLNENGDGGALYIFVSTNLLRLSNLTFQNNVATVGGNGNGGGMFVREVSEINCVDLRFEANIGTRSEGYASGGAVYAKYQSGYGSWTCDNCTFVSNQASEKGSGKGGGAYLFGYEVNITSNYYINNSAAESPFLEGNGGGIFIDEVDTIVLDRLIVLGCVFANNVAGNDGLGGGGAIYMKQSVNEVKIELSTFTFNSAPESGGAVSLAMRKLSKSSFINCTFTSNTLTSLSSGKGGAVCFSTNSIHTNLVSECTFLKNKACAESGEGKGGAIYGSISLFISSCSFESNVGSSKGRGEGGAVYVSSDLNVEKCRFLSNIASQGGVGRGGAIVSTYDVEKRNSTPRCEIYNVDFLSNLASSSNDGFGGALYVEKNHFRIHNCTFKYNKASESGTGSGGGIWAGKVLLGHVREEVNETSFEGNTASDEKNGYGGGFYLQDVGTSVSLSGLGTVGRNIASKGKNMVGKGGFLYSSRATEIRIVECENSSAGCDSSNFECNEASTNGFGFGGAFHLESSVVRFTGSAGFKSNIAGAQMGLGGAISLDSSDLCGDNFYFDNNLGSCYGSGQGGAIYTYGTANFSANGGRFRENKGSVHQLGEGGACFLSDNSTLYMEKVEFTENCGSEFSIGGGGALFLDGYSQFHSQNSYYEYNIASEHQYGRGGVIYARNHSSFSLSCTDEENCHAVDNTGSRESLGLGGVLYTDDSSSGWMSNFSLVYNFASRGRESGTGYGGAVYMTLQSSLSVVNSNFDYDHPNYATDDGSGEGGALYLYGKEFSMKGGIIYICDGAGSPVVIKSGISNFSDVLFDYSWTYGEGGGAISIHLGKELYHLYVNVIDCEFTKNSNLYGGGGGAVSIACQDCDSSNLVRIEGSIFEHNAAGGIWQWAGYEWYLTAPSNGGAISLTGVSSDSVILRDCIFTNNYASERGGAIALHGSAIETTGCKFQDNVATDGGGIALLPKSSAKSKSNDAQTFEDDDNEYHVDLVNISCTSNSALTGKGGCLFIHEFNEPDRAIILFENSVCSSCKADMGGCIAMDESTILHIDESSHIVRNVAEQFGGGIFISGNLNDECTISGNIRNNSADDAGGNIYGNCKVKNYDLNCPTLNNGLSNGTTNGYGPNSATSSCNSTLSGISNTFFPGKKYEVEVQLVDSCMHNASSVEGGIFQAEDVEAVSGSTWLAAVLEGKVRFEIEFDSAELNSTHELVVKRQDRDTDDQNVDELDCLKEIRRSLRAVSCPMGWRTDTNVKGEKYKCQDCGAGQYTLVEHWEGKVCCSCAELTGATCNNIEASSTAVSNKRGHYAYSRDRDDCVETLPCPEEFCESWGNGDPYEENVCTHCWKNQPVHNKCRRGHEGFLCAKCEDGYSLWGGVCKPCTKTQGAVVFGWIILAQVYVFLQHIVSQSTNPAMKILMSFFQLSLIVGGGRFHLEFFSFELGTGGDCPFARSQIAKYFMSLLTPLLLFFQLGLLLVTGKILRTWILTTYWQNRFSKYLQSSSFVRTASMLLMFSYSTVLQSSMSFINCRKFGPELLVQDTPGIDCDSDKYRAVSWFFWIWVIVSLIFPFAFLNFLWRSAKLHRLEDVLFIRKYGCFFEAFSLKFYWYEFVFIFRRTLFIGVWSLFGGLEDDAHGIRTYILLILSLVYLLLHISWKPFKKRVDNMVEYVALSLLVCLSGLHASELFTTNTEASGITAYLAILFLFAGLILIGNIIYRKGEKRIELVARKVTAAVQRVRGHTTAEDERRQVFARRETVLTIPQIKGNAFRTAVQRRRTILFGRSDDVEMKVVRNPIQALGEGEKSSDRVLEDSGNTI